MEIEESQFNKVKKDMILNRGFSISRISGNTRDEFCEYAKEEWADDRGAAFSHIFKFFKGECNSNHEEIYIKLDMLADEIAALKTKLEQKKEPEEFETRLDGTKVRKVK